MGGRCRLEPEIPARETGTAGPHVFNGFGIHSTNRTSNTALIDESLAPIASLPASFTHQNGRRSSHMIAARISFGFGLLSERNARQSLLAVKRKPKKQPAFKQLDVTNPPFLFH